MTVVAVSHGYPPGWNMGGEVALHRSMTAIRGARLALTEAPTPYDIDGVHVEQLNLPNLLDIHADPAPLLEQLQQHNALVVIGQNELSLPAAKAARTLNIPSIVNVHTPPKYGSTIRAALPIADHGVYNTYTSAVQWGEPDALVMHPPASPLPSKPKPTGDAYTLLSSLTHKGVEVVLELAKRMPDQRFIIVESPAKHMEPADLAERIDLMSNVELHPRVAPDEVAEKYLSQTRILLVPGRYETYGMSAIEAAGYGIPSIHVDTPHAREGIGEAAVLIPGLNVNAAHAAIEQVEQTYTRRQHLARARAEWLAAREQFELEAWADFIDTVAVRPEGQRRERQQRITRTALRHR